MAVDFLIVTPLAEERDAVLERLPGHNKLAPSEEYVHVYYEAEIPVTFAGGGSSHYSAIVLPLAKMGQTEAAGATGEAVRHWKPRYVLLVGIAGGLEKAGVKLGDVLIADQVAGYELQKVEPEKTTIRWQVHPVDQRLWNASQNFTDRAWEQTTVPRPNRRQPQVRFGPICTGNKVIAKKDVTDQLRDVWAKMIGVEMEAGGVANAAFQAAKIPGFFMVRGVSDLADGDKNTKRVKRWRPYACEIAAAYAIEFLKSGPVPEAKDSETSLPVEEKAVVVEVSPTRLRHGAEHLVGRERELARLDAAWHDPKTHVVSIVAWGGVGKTSLAIDWMARMAAEGWRGAERVFDWSFYSQGTREEGEASADLFVREALRFFGDAEMAESSASAWEKGERLARLVAERKTLLVLDGLEPLQHPPGPLGGKLKDPTLECLLKGLAQSNPGLCIVTTRESVTDLAPFRETTAPEWELESLSEEAGARLLHRAGARRAGTAEIAPDDTELKEASREVQGHALTLTLLGGYLGLACDGDVRQRNEVEFQEADAEVQGGHAFRVMGAYEKWLASSTEADRRSLAILRLMGFFERPADPGCIAELCRDPAIAGLTEVLAGASDKQRKVAVKRLESLDLIRTAPWAPKKIKGYNEETAKQAMRSWSMKRAFDLGDATEDASAGSFHPSSFILHPSLDSHPLVREYFAKQIRDGQPKAWREGHRRLFEHLKDSVPYWPEGADGLQPLYQAVAHGCLAGLYEKACYEVYVARINRGTSAAGFYSTKKLGLFGSDLGAVRCFFETPWSRLAPSLDVAAQAWLLGVAAFNLRALGRLNEALEPMRVGLQMRIEQEVWGSAARIANNLSELDLALGNVSEAVRDAKDSVKFADESKDAFMPVVARTTLADAFHQAGRRNEALERFRDAEDMQEKDQAEYPLLYSLRGFRYCDLLLSAAERTTWQHILNSKLKTQNSKLIKVCHEVEERASKTLTWDTPFGRFPDIGLHTLTLARAALYLVLFEHSAFPIPHSAFEPARRRIAAAVDGLHAAGVQDYLARGLLTRAFVRFVDGDASDAQADLDEALRIAERGSMRLFMADVHLDRARLFHAVEPYPWEGKPGTATSFPTKAVRLDAASDEKRGDSPRFSPHADLAAARALIEECGYHRRDAELADAEAALGDAP